MPRHPTVEVPNIGAMDHAWDLLGVWEAELEAPDGESAVHGTVTFNSWADAELHWDPVEAAVAGATVDDHRSALRERLKRTLHVGDPAPVRARAARL